ncbi:MAG: tetratricopeptide repeat protein [Bacteroidales bacterium]
MERKKMYMISLFLVLTFFAIPVTPSLLSAKNNPGQMIYNAFVEEKMDQWADAMSILENQYRQSGSTEILYELLLARYGYIGYSLSIDNKSEARRQISLAEDSIDELSASPAHESSAYALQAALYAYRISMAPWRAVFWGQKSMNLIDKAIETDPGNPSAWIEHGNAMFYAPSALGGSKEEAIKSYSRAIRLFEEDMNENHRWLYLNTLVSLANSYEETGNKSMARITYNKALEFEPDFKWVKEELLPELIKD